MNGTWHTFLMGNSPPGFLSVSEGLLAQTTVPGQGFFGPLGQNITGFVPSLIAAIVILVVGWIIAAIISSIVRSLLNRTDIDNRLAAWISGDSVENGPNVEAWISGAIFWIIIILTVVAALQTLQLTAVTDPLNAFLNQVIGYIPLILGALILLGIAWLLATIVKVVVTRTLKAFGLDERLGDQLREDTHHYSAANTPEGTVEGVGLDGIDDVNTTQTTQPTQGVTRPTPPPAARAVNDDFSLSETIGNALYWLVFLLFLPSILGALNLQGTLLPVQQLVNEILSILPNILAAIIIAAAGWVVAQVVRRIVTNLLIAAGTERVGARFGLLGTTKTNSLSWLLGTLVFIFILIPTAIAALNALRIRAISEPAIIMLQQILNLLPRLFAAGVVLVLAYVVGHYISDLVRDILTSVGFNNIFRWLGFSQSRTVQAPPRPTPETGEPTVIQPQTRQFQTRTPSELVGIIVLVGIMLFATLAAVNILEITALTLLVAGIVLIAGQILAGLIVFAIGLYLANLAYNLIASSGNRQSRILASTARIAIIALVSAMALEQMGVAGNIVNLAFGLLLGAIAVAIALAFGLGSRDIAARQVQEWLDSFKRQ